MNRCKNCGGENLQMMAWVSANSKEFIDYLEGHPLWCEDCEDEVDSEWIED